MTIPPAEGSLPASQSQRNESHGCYYTRTTGIWQTVWLEFVPESYVVRAKYITDIKNGSVSIDADCICGEGAVLECQVSFDGTAVASGSASVCSGHAKLTLPIPDPKLWEPGNGRLYDLELCLGDDVVKSYFGMRSVSVRDGKMLINGKKVFQRLVLDQGFYPDGIYTAPDDAALENDIKLSMALGFNGARLHQKVFEERFLTYCDKMGYIVWGEYPNWGMSPDVEHDGFTDEWLESVRRDFNHPSVIGWCPFNETERDFDKALVRHVVEATQNSDPTRPVIDTSGWFHSGSGDILDTHDYDQNPESFKNRYDRLVDEGETQSAFPGDTGHFTFVSEYGGIGWSSDGGWGYGDMPKTKDELLERYRGLTDALLDNPELFGFCYTQLTDVEQERNGLYTYDRKPKFDCELIRRTISAGRRMKMNDERFAAALAAAELDRPEARKCIGTLGEHTLHFVLKHYCESNSGFHEQKIGRYYADVCNGSMIYEVQTRALYKLAPKLRDFLPHYSVNVVFPVFGIKRIVWTDSSDGRDDDSAPQPQSRTHHRRAARALRSARFFDHPEFRLTLVMFDGTEYRVYDGGSRAGRRRAHRLDVVPESIADIRELGCMDDCRETFAKLLPDRFTASSLYRSLKLYGVKGWRALRFLRECGAVAESGKQGRQTVYETRPVRYDMEGGGVSGV